jgi:VCBS repeat-containing protein
MGNDTYIIDAGGGVDHLVDPGGHDILQFGAGIDANAISLDLGSLLIRIGTGGDVIHVEGFDPQRPFDAPAIDEFRFADGTVLSHSELLQRGFDLYGTPGGDTVSGTAVTDRIQGLAGNDILAGGAGDDTYVVRLGDGADRIVDGEGGDTLFVGSGLNEFDLEAERIGDSLLIHTIGTEDFVTLDNWYGQAEGIDRIVFGDGSSLDRTGIDELRNRPPVANADSITVHEDGGALTFAATNLLVNDTDPNPGDVLTVIGVGTSQVGANVALANGQVTYGIGNAFQELAAGEVLRDSFSYTIADRKGAQAASLVNVDIVGVNDAPVTAADTAATVEDTLQPVTGNVLANDSDVDHGTVLRIAAPGAYVGAYGTLTLQADGSYAYALANGSLAVQALAQAQVVIDHFAYDATDGMVAVGATLDITVTGINDAPVVAGDAGLVGEDGVLFATGNVLANDSDVDAGTVLQVAAPGAYVGAYGTLTLQADGSYGYSLNNDSLAVQSLAGGTSAIDHFAYAATDGLVATVSALDITVQGVNDAPVTVNDAAIVVEDRLTTASGNVLANDHDVDHGTVLQVANPGTYAGEFGSLALATNGAFTYSIDNTARKVQSLGREAVAVEHFAYTATDGQVGTNATLDVFLHGTNDAPIVVRPLVDREVKSNKAFCWQIPEFSFRDIDRGDTLSFTATRADGNALPSWLRFDAKTRTFSGMAPKKETALDIRITATDKVAASGSTDGSLSASDVFRLEVEHGNVRDDHDDDRHDDHHGNGQGSGWHGDSHGGGRGNQDKDRDKDRDDEHGSHGDRDDRGRQRSASYACLDPRLVAEYCGKYDEARGGRSGSNDASIFARWLAMDLAVSKALAGKGPAWLDDGHGADTAVLNRATSGFLGSNHAFGKDAFSLSAGAQNLQNFKGLAEGMQKIA